MKTTSGGHSTSSPPAKVRSGWGICAAKRECEAVCVEIVKFVGVLPTRPYNDQTYEQRRTSLGFPPPVAAMPYGSLCTEGFCVPPEQQDHPSVCVLSSRLQYQVERFSCTYRRLLNIIPNCPHTGSFDFKEAQGNKIFLFPCALCQFVDIEVL